MDGGTDADRARRQVNGLGLAVAAFQRDTGRLPSPAEGLGALLVRPPDLAPEGWQGPYMDVSVIPPDPWGRDYVYRLRPGDAERPFTVYSLGPDGTSATAGDDPDDIALWPAGAVSPAGRDDGTRVTGLLSRLMRGPFGLVLLLVVAVSWLRFAMVRMARMQQPHPGGYVPRRRRRHRPSPPSGGPGPNCE